MRCRDVQLADSGSYIFVERTWDGRRTGSFDVPKGNRSRRVDVTPTLRDALLALRDRRMLEAFRKGKLSIAEDLVFGNQEGRPFKRGNVMTRHFEPLLERAEVRRIRFHDLRHTYGSLLLECGATLKYVSEQMGHSTVDITAKVYCHKLSDGNTAQVTRLSDALERQAQEEKAKAGAHESRKEIRKPDASPQLSATPAQPARDGEMSDFGQVLVGQWLGGRDSNPDTQIQSLQSYR